MAKTNHSTLKALDVLEMLAREEDGLRLTDISVGAGFPISTTRRLLMSLIERSYVEQDAQTSRYYLGPKILTLQAQGLRQRHVIRVAYPILKQLQNALDETINLGVLGDRTVICLESMATESSFAFYTPPGTKSPLHCTAMGKLLLSYLDDDRRAAVLNELDWKRYTPKTITSAEELLVQLNQIREQGYSYDDEEYSIGVRCVAVPVFSRARHPAASMSVTTLSTRLEPARRDEVRERLLEASAQISAAIGYTPPR